MGMEEPATGGGGGLTQGGFYQEPKEAVGFATLGALVRR